MKLFEQFIREDQELVAVKYFSAIPLKEDKNGRQDKFFQANNENKKFKLILGKYIKKTITCYGCGYNILTHEEKQTDVRIATQIVADAFMKKCDISIIVSADSDLIPAIEFAEEARNKVYVYFPPAQYSNDLDTASHGQAYVLNKYEYRFKKALLPESITLNKSGYEIKIPDKWKIFKEKKQ